jgi:hypothetical protein
VGLGALLGIAVADVMRTSSPRRRPKTRREASVLLLSSSFTGLPPGLPGRCGSRVSHLHIRAALTLIGEAAVFSDRWAIPDQEVATSDAYDP